MTTTRQPVTRPSRRTLVKGAAWATPVIAVASAAPAMANSPGCIDVEVECWTVGPRNTFSFDVCFINSCPGRPANVQIASVTVVSARQEGSRTLTPPESGNLDVQFGTPWCQTLSYGGNNNNDSPVTVRIDYTVGGLVDPMTATAVPPCSGAGAPAQLEYESLPKSKDEQETQPVVVTAVPEPEDTATESAPEPVVDQAEKTATPTSDN